MNSSVGMNTTRRATQLFVYKTRAARDSVVEDSIDKLHVHLCTKIYCNAFIDMVVIDIISVDAIDVTKFGAIN